MESFLSILLPEVEKITTFALLKNNVRSYVERNFSHYRATRTL
jgi:hypothetical protein